MAVSLVGGAAIGAAFRELLKAVIHMKGKAVMFKPTLAYLTTTLTAIDPVIKEIEQQNKELGRANAELELLMKEMKEGTKLVYECSKIHRLNFPARIRYQEQLVALVDFLFRLFMIDIQAQILRDSKETLIVSKETQMQVRRLHSMVNKMQLTSNGEETGGGLVSESDSGSADVLVELNQIDVNDETTITIQQQNDENVTEITYSLPEEIAVESEILRNDSVEQVMEDLLPVEFNLIDFSEESDENVKEITNSVAEISVEVETLRNDSVEQVMEEGTRLFFIASQTKEKAKNSQEEKHLTAVKSYDQGVGKISYSHRNRCYNDHIPGEIIIFEGCPYKFDIEDLLRGSAEVLGNKSYATTSKIRLENGITLVMKRLKDVKVKKKEFEQQIEIVQRISQHPNVLPPLACYCSNDENLLIFDYMSTGSFFKLLHGRIQDRRAPLDWDSRMKISLGVAKGLAHVHSLEGGTYVHRNIRSSNVLVTNDHQGCISDPSMTYSLSNSFNQFRKTGYQEKDRCFGAMKQVKLTQKCDVYSFGILLFEMLTGRLPSEYNDNLSTDVYYDARRGIHVFDCAIDDNIEYAMKMRLLAERCVSIVPSKRPSMAEVVSEMEEIIAWEFILVKSRIW